MGRQSGKPLATIPPTIRSLGPISREEIAQVAHSLDEEAASRVRAEAVARLRAAVESGTYRVDAHQLAEAILADEFWE